VKKYLETPTAHLLKTIIFFIVSFLAIYTLFVFVSILDKISLSMPIVAVLVILCATSVAVFGFIAIIRLARQPHMHLKTALIFCLAGVCVIHILWALVFILPPPKSTTVVLFMLCTTIAATTVFISIIKNFKKYSQNL